MALRPCLAAVNRAPRLGDASNCPVAVRWRPPNKRRRYWGDAGGNLSFPRLPCLPQVSRPSLPHRVLGRCFQRPFNLTPYIYPEKWIEQAGLCQHLHVSPGKDGVISQIMMVHVSYRESGVPWGSARHLARSRPRKACPLPIARHPPLACMALPPGKTECARSAQRRGGAERALKSRDKAITPASVQRSDNASLTEDRGAAIRRDAGGPANQLRPGPAGTAMPVPARSRRGARRRC